MSGFRRTNGQGTGLRQGTGLSQGGGAKFQPKCPHCIHLNQSLPSDQQLRTDHHMRESPDKNSRFICTVLKSTICEKCGAKGHSAFLCKSDDTSHSQFLAKMRREREYNEDREQLKRVEKAAAVSKNNAFALLDASDESSDDEASDNRLQARKQEKTRAMLQQQEPLRALDTPVADIVVVLESGPSWPLAGQKASAMDWANCSDDEDDMTEELKGWQQVSNHFANGGRSEDWSEQDEN